MMMDIISVSELIEKMIRFLSGNLRDINHFMAVWSYAKIIGELEHLDSETQFILEVAVVIHDIACPLCRQKYGNADGKNQEKESEPLVREFLADTGLEDGQIETAKTVTAKLKLYEYVPAMCRLDYAMGEAGGVSEFVRKYTLSSGDPYCDYGYKKS